MNAPTGATIGLVGRGSHYPPAYSPVRPCPLPRLARVRQALDGVRVGDVRAAVADGFAAQARDLFEPGERVAITVGSRGIADLPAIVAAVASEVRAQGAAPFVVPAMGSHGGATAEGQREVIAGYGVTEQCVGCPVVSSMESVLLGETEAGVPVYCDRAAYEADAIVLLNRVKPHTSLGGELGSGLLKMAAVGLGKERGASTLHRAGLADHLLPAARVVLARAPVRLGVALIENGLGQTARVEVLPAGSIADADKRLQGEARALLPGIPFDPLHVLIVDRIGKNISGTGMDPNVIGMHRRTGGAPERTIERIVALDLSDESHGNANGVGMADVILERLRAKIDWHATYTNAVTGNFLVGAKLPLVCPSAADAVALAVAPYEPERLRAVRVGDTAHLGELWVSEALLPEVREHPALEQVGEFEEMVL